MELIMMTNVQNIILDAMCDLNNLIIRMPRGGGKDYTLMTYAIEEASFGRRSNRIAIVSPTFRQTKLSFKNKLVESITTGAKTTIGTNMCTVEFDNGSLIIGSSINELAVDPFNVLIINEANSIDGYFIDLILDYMRVNVLTKIFTFSTGYRDDSPLCKLEQNENFSTLSFGYKAYPEYYYDKDNINESKKYMDKDRFDMEFNCKVIKVKDDARS